MSRRVHRAALAVTTDGTMLVNLAHFGGEKNAREVFRQALEEKGELFIGVVLSKRETDDTVARLDNASAEAAAIVVGKRRRRARKK